MSILCVKNLNKKYPAFELKDVSFALERGKITGFIGRNGAGKSTTLKAMLNYVHADSGSIEFFGMRLENNEQDIKQRIGFVSGAVNYYAKKRLKVITQITKKFYANWDDDAYAKYIHLFKLDENKTPLELSAGMKVKYSIALALSHNAELLILDEPTSGLDPISREELLDIFMDLKDKGITILFSTHITSDLDKTADNIIYIRDGRIQESGTMKEFVESYKVVDLAEAEKNDPRFIGLKRTKTGYSALVKNTDAEGINAKDANLEQIMVHLEKEEA